MLDRGAYSAGKDPVAMAVVARDMDEARWEADGHGSEPPPPLWAVVNIPYREDDGTAVNATSGQQVVPWRPPEFEEKERFMHHVQFDAYFMDHLIPKQVAEDWRATDGWLRDTGVYDSDLHGGFLMVAPKHVKKAAPLGDPANAAAKFLGIS